MRSSGRARSPSNPSQKAREAGAGDQQATRSTGRVGFRKFGERHAEEVERRGGEEQSDDDEEVEAVTVVLGKQVEAAAQPTEPKPKKTRVSKKWNTLYDLVLAQKALKHEIWYVNGASLTVKEKWVNCLQELNTEEPHCRVFANKSDTSIQSHYNDIVTKQSGDNSAAQREFGGGTDPDSQGSESEKQMKIDLKKTLNAIVDAKAAARQDSASSKQKKVDAVAQNTLLGTVQVSQGKARCGPGSKATSFGDAVRADEVAMVNALANSVPAGTRGGRSSPLTAGNSGSSGATSSGRWSPLTAGSSSSSGALSSDRSTPAAADGTVSIPALGDELAKEMGAPSIADLARDTGATNEQAGRFLKTGFTYDLLPRGKATAMMTRVLKQKLFLNRGDKDVEDYIAEGKDFDEHDFEVPGLDGLLLKKLCHHYGMDEDDFYSCDDAFGYANGWHVDCQASSAKFDVQTERLANLLIPGPVGTPPAPSSSNASGAAPADSIINLGPSRRGNRGKKSRNNSNKLREEGLEGFLDRQIQAAEKHAATPKAAEDAKEARHMERMKELMAHDRQLRQDEFNFQRQLREDERAADRAEKKEDRAHQLELLKLQVQLAQAQAGAKSSS